MLPDWFRSLRRWSRCGADGRPTEGELDDLLEHLAFEVAALESAADLFLKHGYWVFLDTFLVHARLLRDFLWARRNPRYRMTEVLAEHYSADWAALRPPLPVILKATRKAINAQLAHISRDRVRVGKTRDLGADIVPLRDAVRVGWRSFLATLGAHSRAAQLRAAVAQKCAVLGVTAPP